MSETNSGVTKHIAIVGDGEVGKTCLLHAFTDETFFLDYIPTIYEKEEFELTLDNVVHSVKLHDTAGQEEYDKLRKLIYRQTDCFILCYSIDRHSSFENIVSKWIPELRSTDRKIPIVLVATKVDLRTNHNISTARGQALADEINANTFVESSAKQNHMVKEVFYEAVRAAVAGAPKDADIDDPTCGCTIL